MMRMNININDENEMLNNINEPESHGYKKIWSSENESEEEVEEALEEMDKEIDFFNIEDNNINGSGTVSLFDRLLSNKNFLIYLN